MRKNQGDSGEDTVSMLKKLLMLQLFQLGATQAEIAKKLKVDRNAVNSFLKGVKKPHGPKGA